MKYLKIEYLKNHLFCTERTDWLEYGIRNRRKSHKQNRNWSKHGINSCWLICAWEKRADWVWKRYLRNKIKGIQHGQKRFWNPKSSLHNRCGNRCGSSCRCAGGRSHSGGRDCLAGRRVGGLAVARRLAGGKQEGDGGKDG